MSDINCIKRLRNHKGLSINSIKNTLGINWRTAKKYGDEDQIPKEKVVQKKGMMYEEHWGEIVSDWLIEDSRLRKKARRTVTQMHKDLNELGFTGSYRTVCDFVADWKKTHAEEDHKSYERLEHPPGEAQVDFGVMEAVQDGEYVDIHTLVMSYPFSNAAFAVPLPSENQECFLEGLKALFHQSNCVPKSIRIDNLTPAVKKTRSKFEEAQLTDEFIQFQNHYGFEVQVCNPRSGHEKGHVENKVGYVRYNFFNAAPLMNDFQDLREKLREKLAEDRQRVHYEKEVLIENLWSQEMQSTLALHPENYYVFTDKAVKVNKYSEIKIDNVMVHIPRAKYFSLIHLILTWNEFKAVSPDGEILLKDYRPYMNKRRAIPWLSVFKEWVRKPRVVNYSRYAQYLPGRVKNYLLVDNLILRRERIKEMANLLVTHDMKKINEEFYDLIEKSNGDAYGVNWTSYDALTPQQAKGGSQI